MRSLSAWASAFSMPPSMRWVRSSRTRLNIGRTNFQNTNRTTANGISDQTIYLCRKRYGALEAVDVKRLRHLEQENARMKKLVAERDLELEVMKEVAAKKW